MTKYTFAVLVILLATSCRRQASVKNDAPSAEIEFLTETNHDFGSYCERDTVFFDFVYKNVGKVPFVINRIVTSCGCTKARYAKHAVRPGETDTIRVLYDGAGFSEGSFTKRCDIYSNADTVYQLRIHGYYYNPR